MAAKHTTKPQHSHSLRFDLSVTDGTFNATGIEHPEITLPNLFPEPRAEVPTVSVCLSGHDALGLELVAAELERGAKAIRRHAERLALVELRHAARMKDAADPLEEYDSSCDPPRFRDDFLPGGDAAPAPKPPAPKKSRRGRRSKAELDMERKAAYEAAEAAGAKPIELDDATGHGKITEQIAALQKLTAAVVARRKPPSDTQQPTLTNV